MIKKISPRTHRQGFTLIELLAVLAIIGILAAIIVPKIGDATGKARRLACATNMKNIVKSMQIYHEDHGNSPIAASNETTLVIFGRLYYNMTDKDGDQKAGVTSMQLYNCPSSTSTPPQPTTGYYAPLQVAAPQNIDYGVVITGNSLNFKKDPDGNVILVEIAETNHAGGRNVAFWDSSVQFIPEMSVVNDEIAAYPMNKQSSGASEGANVSTNYTTATGAILDTTGAVDLTIT